MDKTGITYDEYYYIIKNEKEKLSLIKKELDEKNSTFSKCCEVKNDTVFLGFPRMQEILNNGREKEYFKKILEYVFGYAFFEDLTEEQKEEYKKKDIFTKYDLDENDFFGKVYGVHYGLEFKRPTSWDDMILFLNNVFNVINNNFISDLSKEPYHIILFAFNKLIENYYANSLAKSRKLNFIFKTYDEFLLAFDQKRKISIDERNYPLIKEILNKDSRTFTSLEGPEEKKIGFGDMFIMFCGQYNSNIEKALENKEREKEELEKNKKQLKIQTQVDKYYKRVKGIPFDKIENKNFPKYTNENYVQVIKGVIEKFLEDLNNDEKWLPYYTVSQMHYASYFKTKYYDEDKFNKEWENVYGGKN